MPQNASKWLKMPQLCLKMPQNAYKCLKMPQNA